MNIIMHYPTSEAGRKELASRVATVHAEAVNNRIQKLTCPTEQKQALVNAVVSAKKQELSAKK